jgi:hypothetical protein
VTSTPEVSEARTDALLAELSARPDITETFEAVEHALRDAERWSHLAGAYELRIGALRSPLERAHVLVRLARLLEQQLDSPRAALTRLTEARAQAPADPLVLAELRKLLTRRRDWTGALQIAEVEEQLDLHTSERADLLVAIADLFQKVGDAGEERQRLEEAFQVDPSHRAARERLVEMAARDGRPDVAARLIEMRLAQLETSLATGSAGGVPRPEATSPSAAASPAEGATVASAKDAERDARAERAALEIELARILRPHAPERARAALRKAAARPDAEPGVVAELLETECDAGHWDGLTSFATARWRDLPAGEVRRDFALDLARRLLDRARQPTAAVDWILRAQEDGPPSPAALDLCVSLFRQTGQADRLLLALTELDAHAPPDPERALEIAALLAGEGRIEEAALRLRDLVQTHPDDARVLAALDGYLAALDRGLDRCAVLARRATLAETPAEAGALHAERGDALAAAGETANAEAAYRRALELLPTCEAAIAGLRTALAGRRDALAEVLIDAARQIGSGPLCAARWLEAAAALSDAGAVEAAIDACTSALQADVGSTAAPAALRRLAAVHGEARARAIACEAELRAATAPEQRAPLLGELAATKRDIGDLCGARACAEHWAMLDPGPAPHRMRVELAHAAGDMLAERRSLEALDALVATGDPAELCACRERLGDLCAAAGEHPQSQHWYREAMRAGAGSAVRTKLIAAYRAAGQLGELADALRAQLAEARDASSTGARIELATALRELGDLAGATAELWAVFRADPTSGAAADMLETTLEATEDHETLATVLDTRARKARSAVERRGAATRLAALLLDRLARPSDTVAALAPHVDPFRSERTEELYERALLAAQDDAGQVAWYQRRAEHLEDEPLREALLRLGRAQARAGETAAAIATLERAERTWPDDDLDLLARPLLALAKDEADPALRLRLLGRLADNAKTAHARTAFLLERARVCIQDCGELDQGAVELARIGRAGPLRRSELRLWCALARALPDRGSLIDALQALCAATQSADESAALRLELATEYLEGPEPTRDAAAGERLLRGLLEHEAVRHTAFTKLAAWLDRLGRDAELCDLLEARLASGTAPPRARPRLVLDLAAGLLRLGRAAPAARLLEEERERAGALPELDTWLARALEQAGDLAGCEALLAERTLQAEGPARIRTLHHWLEVLQARGAPPQRQLEVVERLLASGGADLELTLLRIELLRDCGESAPLAHALEDLVATHDLSPARRCALVRELLRMHEGPLDSPRAALALIEREVTRDPSLRVRAVALAARVGDARRERRHIEALLEAQGPDAPEARGWSRRLALLQAEAGEHEAAATRLAEALARCPRDLAVLRALEQIERRRARPHALLALLEHRYQLEDQRRRGTLAREAFHIAEQLCDSATALRWLRRWQSFDALPKDVTERWLMLERALGEPAGVCRALACLREHTSDPRQRAALLAQEAEILTACGELTPAREAYGEAIDLAPERAAPWLRALETLARREGRTDDEITLLDKLAHHPELEADERARCRVQRIRLLAERPEARVRAASELRELLDASPSHDRRETAERLRWLLELYEELGATADWCEIAPRLLPLADAAEATALERSLARGLQRLAAHDRALAMWAQVLERSPDDREALAARAELLHRPGDEEPRARTLEALAESLAAERPAEAAALWQKAAALRFRDLASPDRALRNIERAVALDPTSERSHALRAELCEHLGQAAAEEDSLRVLVQADAEREALAARWLRLAQVLHTRGASAADICDALDRAIQHAPAGDLARVRARKLYARLGRWEDVAVLLAQELERPALPKEARAPLLRELARVHLEEQGEPRAACAALEDLAATAPLQAVDLERWADALAALGRGQESLLRRERGLLVLGDRACARDWLALATDLVATQDGASSGGSHTPEPSAGAAADGSRTPAEPERERRELDRAREACERAFQLASGPERATALDMRIALDARRGDVAREAGGWIDRAELRAEPADAAADLARAAHLLRGTADGVQRAGAAIEQALEHDATSLAALWVGAELAQSEGAWERAEQLYARVLDRLRFDPAVPIAPEGGRSSAGGHDLWHGTAAASPHADVAGSAGDAVRIDGDASGSARPHAPCEGTSDDVPAADILYATGGWEHRAPADADVMAGALAGATGAGASSVASSDAASPEAGAAAIAPALFAPWSGTDSRLGEIGLHIDGDPSSVIATAARAAARAALRRERRAAASHYLDVAIVAAPADTAVLRDQTELCLRLGHLERARACLEAELAAPGGSPEERAFARVLLAETCERLGDMAAAAAALETPPAESALLGFARERVVDLLERLGETDRALTQLALWSRHARAEFVPGLEARAARIEALAGRPAEARARLEGLTERHPERATAWIDLVALLRDQGQALAALEVGRRALEHVAASGARVALSFECAQCLEVLDRRSEAMAMAGQVVDLDPTHLDAAQMLARGLLRGAGAPADLDRLERVLVEGAAPPPVEATLAFALGHAEARLQGSPERACAALRAALAANPLHEGARQALADLTARLPAHHSEGVALQRDVLREQPARRASWEALTQIADQQGRERAALTCRTVCAVLEATPAAHAHEPSRTLLVDSAAPDAPGHRAFADALSCLDELDLLPADPSPALQDAAHPGVAAALARLAGRAPWLTLDQLQGALELVMEADEKLPDLPWRASRRLRRARRDLEALGAPLDLAQWRIDALAHGGALALAAGEAATADALESMLRLWPETAGCDLRRTEAWAALAPLCPPAEALLARIASAVLADLPAR